MKRRDCLCSTGVLEHIVEPADLKELRPCCLQKLADEIRTFLIEKISRTGGHIASNLGVVELTIALHTVFSSPKDKLVWDVGHQTYVHKILTGRKDELVNIRQMGAFRVSPKYLKASMIALIQGTAQLLCLQPREWPEPVISWEKTITL